MPLSPLLSRLLYLLLILAAEVLCFTLWLDTASLPQTHTLVRLLAYSGSQFLRLGIALICFGACLLPTRLTSHRPSLDVLARQPIRWSLLGLHALCLSLLAFLSRVLFAQILPAWNGDAIAILWFLSGIGSTIALALVFLPVTLWRRIWTLGGAAWGYTFLAATTAVLLASASSALWRPTARLTFTLVAAVLQPLVAGLQTDPVKFILHSPNFAVQIADACSGLEGVGLMLVFGTAWLLAFRREYRFPRALLLLPAGVLLIFALNVVRLAALFLIGNLGAPNIAAGGFHSQAGWIAFTVSALLFAHLSRRLAFFSSDPAPPAIISDNPAAPYLIPFLAILAAAQISAAFSSGFEYLYPLRLIAAAAALWYFRADYRRLPWRVHWPLALGAGTVVLLIWLALERLIAAPITQPQPPPLAWAILRILGATITVPIAEELAFRGYLLRRIASADFESVSLRAFHWWPFLLSSVAFGLLHGPRAIAGILAGMIYALVLRRNGSLGDAAAAHAITNALLAAWVLTTGQYQLW